MDFQALLLRFNEVFTFFFVFPTIVVLGLYLTFKLRCVQLSKLKMSFSCLLRHSETNQGNISHYQAVSAVLAGNLGTGNISGMAIALSTGGPGALVWMWVMAFLGASIQYASCLLGVKYRKQNEKKEYVGGPMYYLKEGLGFNSAAALFSLFTIIGALTVGNFAQVNSVVLPLKTMGFDPLICGLVMTVLVGGVLIGGIQRIARLASIIVPVKALLYLGTALVILIFHADRILPAFQLMFQAAFSPQSVMGGVAGFSLFKAISVGFDRGIFATDAGTGIVPILQSSARTTNPVIDGVVTLVAPFLVMIVCTTTGLVLLVTGVWENADLKSTNMVTQAFHQGLGHPFGAYVVIVALLLFAYTTILAWACCAQKAIGFLWGNRYAKWFNYFYIALIPMGTFIQVDLIWRLADLSIAFMLVTNLIGVAALSKEVIGQTRRFFVREPELEPVQ